MRFLLEHLDMLNSELIIAGVYMTIAAFRLGWDR